MVNVFGQLRSKEFVIELSEATIFIIEDDLGNRAVMQTLLEQAGAYVHFERWGISSVEKIKKAMPVDIILLDLMFPRGVTGYDVFDEIRNDPELQEIQIVAVSASEPAISIPKTREKGFSGFIAKPISFEDFTTQIHILINNGSIWDAG